MPRKIFDKSITVKKNKQILSLKKDRHVVSFRLPIDVAFSFADRLQKEGLTATQFGRAVVDSFCKGKLKIGGVLVDQKR